MSSKPSRATRGFAIGLALEGEAPLFDKIHRDDGPAAGGLSEGPCDVI